MIKIVVCDNDKLPDFALYVRLAAVRVTCAVRCYVQVSHSHLVQYRLSFKPNNPLGFAFGPCTVLRDFRIR